MPSNAPSDELKILLVEPAARTSNEWELLAAMPDTRLTVVSDRSGWGADREVEVPVLRLPGLSGYEAWAAAPSWLRHLDRAVDDDIELVVSLEVYSISSLQASMLARKRGIPHAAVVFETLPDMFVYRWPPWRQIMLRLRDRIDLFLCISDKARDHLVALGCPPERCRVIQLGVDTATFHPAPELVREPIVQFVGMLRANRGADKGVMDIVDACRTLVRGPVPDLQLRLVGKGHLREELEAIATRDPFLSVLPARPRDQIPALMQSARALVLASKRTAKWEEQFGFVLLEAMATGLPVVATRSGAIPEVVPPWNPLVPEGDVAALAAGIQLALGPDGEDWGRRNRAHVLDHLDLHLQGRQMRELLGEARVHAHG